MCELSEGRALLPDLRQENFSGLYNSTLGPFLALVLLIWVGSYLIVATPVSFPATNQSRGMKQILFLAPRKPTAAGDWQVW